MGMTWIAVDLPEDLQRKKDDFRSAKRILGAVTGDKSLVWASSRGGGAVAAKP